MPHSSPPSWLEDFAPFTPAHLLTVVVCASIIAASCILGRHLRGTPRENLPRIAWGIFSIAVAVPYNTFYLRPSKFALDVSLPLQICDLSMIVAALAMLTQHRPWRTLLYFWGIGLSVQAFITPTLMFGLGYPQFWLFWSCHSAIVGSAFYDLVVGRYRPAARDFRLAIAVTFVYGVLVAWLDARLNLNYGFLGPTKPENPTLIDVLGPWPRRLPIIFFLAAADFFLLWIVWPISSRILARRTPHASAT